MAPRRLLDYLLAVFAYDLSYATTQSTWCKSGLEHRLCNALRDVPLQSGILNNHVRFTVRNGVLANVTRGMVLDTWALRIQPSIHGVTQMLQHLRVDSISPATYAFMLKLDDMEVCGLDSLVEHIAPQSNVLTLCGSATVRATQRRET